MAGDAPTQADPGRPRQERGAVKPVTHLLRGTCGPAVPSQGLSPPLAPAKKYGEQPHRHWQRTTLRKLCASLSRAQQAGNARWAAYTGTLAQPPDTHRLSHPPARQCSSKRRRCRAGCASSPGSPGTCGTAAGCGLHKGGQTAAQHSRLTLACWAGHTCSWLRKSSHRVPQSATECREQGSQIEPASIHGSPSLLGRHTCSWCRWFLQLAARAPRSILPGDVRPARRGRNGRRGSERPNAMASGDVAHEGLQSALCAAVRGRSSKLACADCTWLQSCRWQQL